MNRQEEHIKNTFQQFFKEDQVEAPDHIKSNVLRQFRAAHTATSKPFYQRVLPLWQVAAGFLLLVGAFSYLYLQKTGVIQEVAVEVPNRVYICQTDTIVKTQEKIVEIEVPKIIYRIQEIRIPAPPAEFVNSTPIENRMTSSKIDINQIPPMGSPVSIGRNADDEAALMDLFVELKERD